MKTFGGKSARKKEYGERHLRLRGEKGPLTTMPSSNGRPFVKKASGGWQGKFPRLKKGGAAKNSSVQPKSEDCEKAGTRCGKKESQKRLSFTGGVPRGGECVGKTREGRTTQRGRQGRRQTKKGSGGKKNEETARIPPTSRPAKGTRGGNERGC